MPDQHDRPTSGPSVGAPQAPDADASPEADPIPIPGAAGPMGGSLTGELVDAVDQPIQLPGQRPPLTTDS
jgi:hypothetical protein